MRVFGAGDIRTGVFVATPVVFIFSRPFTPLSSVRVDRARDSDRSENESDVVDSDIESSSTSATQTSDQ